MIAGSAMTKIGRRGATLVFTIPAYALGFLLVGCAGNCTTIIFGRLLTGTGLGLTLSIPTVYVVEISSPEYRGALGVVPNLFCQIGIFCTYVSGAYLVWDWLAYAVAVTAIPFLVAVFFIPESPVYLVSVDRLEEASDVLRLLGHDEDRLIEIQDAICNRGQKTSFNSLFNPTNIKPFLTGVTLMAFFQASSSTPSINSRLLPKSGGLMQLPRFFYL